MPKRPFVLCGCKNSSVARHFAVARGTLMGPFSAVSFNTKVMAWLAITKRARLPMFVSTDFGNRTCSKPDVSFIALYCPNSLSVCQCSNHCLLQFIYHLYLSPIILLIRQQALVCLFHEFSHRAVFSGSARGCPRAGEPLSKCSQ